MATIEKWVLMRALSSAILRMEHLAAITCRSLDDFTEYAQFKTALTALDRGDELKIIDH